jgi:hypothetical protein
MQRRAVLKHSKFRKICRPIFCEICGLTHLRNFRICDSGISSRICQFADLFVIKFVCPPLKQQCEFLSAINVIYFMDTEFVFHTGSTCVFRQQLCRSLNSVQTRGTRAESIEWFIEDQFFSLSYDLVPPTPFPVSKLSLFLSLPVCLLSSFLTGEGSKGVGEEPNGTMREKARPSINRSILCTWATKAVYERDPDYNSGKIEPILKSMSHWSFFCWFSWYLNTNYFLVNHQ